MIVVSGVVLERLPQVGLAEDNCVIETLPADRANYPFHISILPRRSGCCGTVSNTHCPYSLFVDRAVTAIPVPDKVSRRGLPGKGLAHLVGDPSRGRMGGGIGPDQRPSFEV